MVARQRVMRKTEKIKWAKLVRAELDRRGARSLMGQFVGWPADKLVERERCHYECELDTPLGAMRVVVDADGPGTPWLPCCFASDLDRLRLLTGRPDFNPKHNLYLFDCVTAESGLQMVIRHLDQLGRIPATADWFNEAVDRMMAGVDDVNDFGVQHGHGRYPLPINVMAAIVTLRYARQHGLIGPWPR